MILSSLSPLRFWKGWQSGKDSAVFQTVAMMMERGFMPYRDSFDHKGPLLYIINYLGKQVSPVWGLWFIEVIFMWTNLFMMYRIARLVCGHIASCGIMTLSTLPMLLHNYFEGGNFVEEYAMPFIAAALYIFLDYLLNGRISKPRLIICGACMGCVCLLRVNMIPVWIVFCIYIFIRCIREREFASLGRFICFFLIGFCIATFPVLAWLGLNGAFTAFWNDYILFNLDYTAGSGGIAEIKDKIETFMEFFLQPMAVLSFLFTAYMAYITKAKERSIYCIYAVCLVISILFAAISGRVYWHYVMILVPVLVFPLAALCKHCENEIINAKGLSGRKVALIILLTVAMLPHFVYFVYLNFMAKADTASTGIFEICAIIEDNTAPDEPISVFGHWNNVYLTSGRPHATTYSFQSSLSAPLREDYFRQLAEELPKLIIISDSDYLPMMEDFLHEHDYTQIWQASEDFTKEAIIYSLSENY